MDAFDSIGLPDTEAPFAIDNWPSLIRVTLKRKLGIDIAFSNATSVFSGLKDVTPVKTNVYNPGRHWNFCPCFPLPHLHPRTS